MSRLFKRIEVVANLAIIAVAILLGVVVVRTYLLPKNTNAKLPPSKTQIHKGTKVPVTGVDWTKNSQTLVLALSTGCHFCSESAGFYQRLVNAKSTSKTFQLIAVLPQPESDGQRYLSGLGVEVDQVKQAEFATFGVQGTPTILLVDKNGEVMDSWVGKLPETQEQEVLGRLGVSGKI